MRSSSSLLLTLLIVAAACRSQEVAPPAEPSPGTPEQGSGAPAGQSAAAPAAAQEPFGSADQTFLGEEQVRLERLRARQEFLAGQYIQRGNELLERADLEGALAQFSQALEVMPSNQDARTAMRRVEALMGNRYAAVADFMTDAVEQETVRRAQARIAAEEHVLAAENALRRGDLDEAVSRFREAELVLRYHPMIATDSLDEQIVRTKLESAIELQDEARREQRRRIERDAREASASAEREARQYRENRLGALYQESWAAYQRESYKQSENLANQILLLDPGNEDALLMRDVSRSARHERVEETTRRDMAEQWQRTMEGLDQLPIPQTDALLFDDLDRWRTVIDRKPLDFRQTNAPDSRDTQLILDRLEAVRIEPRFGVDGDGAPLSEVATLLQRYTGVNFVISSKVRDELDDEQKSVRLDLGERSVRKVLDLMAEVSELRWRVQDGVVKFVTKEELIGGQVLKFYEVRDLIRPVRDFPGADINVEPSGGLEPPDEEVPERDALVLTSDALEALIRENVDRESWDADPSNSLRITDQGVLVVNQTPEVHEKIQRLLDDLREATGIMVDIQTRFLQVEDNFLEDIGVDFRGLGQPGKGDDVSFDDFGDATAQQDLGAEIGSDSSAGAFLNEGDDGDLKGRIENLFDEDLGDEDVLTGTGGLSFQWTYLNDLQFELLLRAVSKSERVEIVTAPRLLVFNTARANVTVLNQVAYVQDFDVEIAQGASIADPIINIIQDGVVLDVRPVVSADRRFITLELRPTVAVLTRPIRTVTTTLGAASSVTIELPELEIARVRTSVPMPDGGTVMLGGMKLTERQDLRSGVPFLNKLPILSFFFQRKGTFIAKRKLLILLKASIVIPQESEPTPAQLGVFERAE